jgi:CRP/FNR family cyclic AMP-dependent transcriptional regulator
MRKVLYLMGILDDQDVEWLGKNGVMRYVPSGTMLIHEGVSVSPIDDVYVVLDGRLSVSVEAIGNPEIALLYAGEIVGEMSFVDSRPPSASVVATEDSHVLVIPRSVLSSKLRADNAFSARFYKAVATLLADRLRKTVYQLANSKQQEGVDPDELDEDFLERASIGAIRFDRLLKRLRIH